MSYDVGNPAHAREGELEAALRRLLRAFTGQRTSGSQGLVEQRDAVRQAQDALHLQRGIES